MAEVDTDVAVIGGGLGGVAAALAAARTGHRVVLTCHDAWLGGQLTSQAVPPDEHPWIERHGCTASYRRLRDGIRAHYRRWYPLTATARAHPALNPGGGWVSGLCHEPTAAVAVIDALLAPWRTAGRLTILRERHPVAADINGEHVQAVTVAGRDQRTTITARYVIDATELGDLLPLTGAEHVTGAEARADTGEPHAPATAQPHEMQAVSACFAVDHRAGEDHTIDRPASYARWRDQRLPGWPGPRLSFHGPDPHDPRGSIRHTFVPNPEGEPHAAVAAHHADPAANDLWLFRRIVARRNFVPGHFDSDVTLVNWPMLDHVGGPLIGDDHEVVASQRTAARDLAHSLLHWLQTEAPRPDGGTGFPGLQPRGDLLGSDDLLARDLYVRESRRIRARTTIVEQDLVADLRPDGRATSYPDSVGVGAYRMDLHPTTGGRPFFDVPALPFEIPLGALVPVRLRNLLAGAKNLGTTHLTNGCYRLHPVEWNVGEAAGLLAGFCVGRDVEPAQVHEDPRWLTAFQSLLDAQGVERRWPRGSGAPSVD